MPPGKTIQKQTEHFLIKIRIQHLLKKLFLLKNRDTDFLLDALDSMPKEALQTTLRLLEQGIKKQDDLLAKLFKKDSNFGRALKQFIEKNMGSMTRTVSDTEHDQAEKILDQL